MQWPRRATCLLDIRQGWAFTIKVIPCNCKTQNVKERSIAAPPRDSSQPLFDIGDWLKTRCVIIIIAIHQSPVGPIPGDRNHGPGTTHRPIKVCGARRPLSALTDSSWWASGMKRAVIPEMAVIRPFECLLWIWASVYQRIFWCSPVDHRRFKDPLGGWESLEPKDWAELPCGVARTSAFHCRLPELDERDVWYYDMHGKNHGKPMVSVFFFLKLILSQACLSRGMKQCGKEAQ